jgi:bacterioferritin-associated ferredoxin
LMECQGCGAGPAKCPNRRREILEKTLVEPTT